MKYIVSIILFLTAIIAQAQTNLWTGEVDATQDYKSVTINASKFQGIKEGEVIRFYISNIRSKAHFNIMDSNKNNIEGYEDVNLTNIYAPYYEYTIDEVLLNTFVNKGLYVNGWGYKMTSIDIITPDNFDELNAYVPVTDNWTFNNDNPSLKVRLINPTSTDQSARIKIYLQPDTGEDNILFEKTVNVGANKKLSTNVNLSTTPGFYLTYVYVNGLKAYTGRALSSGKRNSTFTIGIKTEDIVSNPDKKSDFKQFWNNTLEELSKVNPNYKLTEIPSNSTDKRKVYLLEFNSLKDKGDTAVVVRGYYAEPTGVGKYPCILHFQGYDDSDPTKAALCLNGDDNTEYAELLLSTRGQGINNRAPYINNYGKWFVYGLENKNNYYYRGAYMDAVRATDFLATREHIDINNIYAQGESQGGALSIAAAALGNIKLRAIAPAIPFMGDFPDYFKITDWPASIAEEARIELGLSEQKMYEILSYFDTKNLAYLVDCPVIESIGLQDKTCPPHTNMAFYNNLPKTIDKKIIYNPLLQHLTPVEWKDLYTEFFKDNITNTTYSYEMTEDQWGTLCFPLSANIPDGLTVYKISGVDNNVITVEEVQTIEANKPYLAKGKKGTYELSGTPYKEYDSPILKNGLLTGTYNTIQINSDNQYVLQNINGNIGFYKVTSAISIPPYKAYLELPDDYSAKAPVLYVEDQSSFLTIENNDLQPSIQYNIFGQKVQSNQQGLNFIIDNQGNKSIYIK